MQLPLLLLGTCSSLTIKGFAVLNLVQVLTKARGVLAAVAPITPLKSDDALVTLLDAILADATLFGWVENKVINAPADGALSLEASPPVAIQAALEAKKIPWQQLVDALPVIIQIWRMFRG